MTNTLTSSLAGVAITKLATDHWLIDLAPAGITSVGGAGSNMTWAEAVGSPGVNWLHKVGTTTLELNSNWVGATPGLNSTCGSTSNPLNQGVTCLVGFGGGDSYFVTVRDKAPVPAPGLLGLFAIALFGVRVFARKPA